MKGTCENTFLSGPAFYLHFTENILWGVRAGHATADQHDRIIGGRMDYHVTGGPRVAGNRSPTGGPRDTLFLKLYVVTNREGSPSICGH